MYTDLYSADNGHGYRITTLHPRIAIASKGSNDIAYFGFASRAAASEFARYCHGLKLRCQVRTAKHTAGAYECKVWSAPYALVQACIDRAIDAEIECDYRAWREHEDYLAG